MIQENYSNVVDSRCVNVVRMLECGVDCRLPLGLSRVSADVDIYHGVARLKRVSGTNDMTVAYDGAASCEQNATRNASADEIYSRKMRRWNIFEALA